MLCGRILYNEAFICFNHIKRPLWTTQPGICTHFYRQLTIGLGKLSTRPLMSQANWILIRNLRKYVNSGTGTGSNCAPFQWLGLMMENNKPVHRAWSFNIIYYKTPARKMITDTPLSRNINKSLLHCDYKHSIGLTVKVIQTLTGACVH